jgi:hypothetical protein
MTRPTSSVRVRRIGYYKETPPIEPVLYDNDRDGIEQDALDVVQNDDVKLDVAHYQQNADGVGKYLQSIPAYSSGEVGAVAATTVVVVFSENVYSTNYATGVTIKINGSAQVIASATRQASKDTVHYVIPAADANDVVTFAYNSATGLIVSEDDAEPIETIAAQTVTNTVAGVAPTFVSAEIGAVGSGTVAVTFSVNVFSGNYVTGTSVTINTGSVGIVSGVRQANHAVIRYVLASPAVNGDEVRWSFDTALGGVIVNEADDTFLATITGQVVTNNVA